jgi:pimeloyl-ACP methyl ester carboxylesterase
MVFVAPWALDSGWWEYEIAALMAQGVRCVAFDRRGHGRSDSTSRGLDFDTLADDLAAVMAQLDLRDVTLVGHSMGCAEVVRYATRHHAARIKRIVLIATITPFLLKTPDNPTGIDATVFDRGRSALARDRPHQIAINADAFFGAPKNSVSQEVKDWCIRMMVDRCSLMTMLELHRVFTTTDFRPELPHVGIPTLLIHGDADVSAPLEMTSRRTAALIPGCELKIYENAAHGLPVTHAERLVADLLAYVKS